MKESLSDNSSMVPGNYILDELAWTDAGMRAN